MVSQTARMMWDIDYTNGVFPHEPVKSVVTNVFSTIAETVLSPPSTNPFDDPSIIAEVINGLDGPHLETLASVVQHLAEDVELELFPIEELVELEDFDDPPAEFEDLVEAMKTPLDQVKVPASVFAAINASGGAFTLKKKLPEADVRPSMKDILAGSQPLKQVDAGPAPLKGNLMDELRSKKLTSAAGRKDAPVSAKVKAELDKQAKGGDFMAALKAKVTNPGFKKVGLPAGKSTTPVPKGGGDPTGMMSVLQIAMAKRNLTLNGKKPDGTTGDGSDDEGGAGWDDGLAPRGTGVLPNYTSMYEKKTMDDYHQTYLTLTGSVIAEELEPDSSYVGKGYRKAYMKEWDRTIRDFYATELRVGDPTPKKLAKMLVFQVAIRLIVEGTLDKIPFKEVSYDFLMRGVGEVSEKMSHEVDPRDPLFARVSIIRDQLRELVKYVEANGFEWFPKMSYIYFYYLAMVFAEVKDTEARLQYISPVNPRLSEYKEMMKRFPILVRKAMEKEMTPEKLAVPTIRQVSFVEKPTGVKWLDAAVLCFGQTRAERLRDHAIAKLANMTIEDGLSTLFDVEYIHVNQEYSNMTTKFKEVILKVLSQGPVRQFVIHAPLKFNNNTAQRIPVELTLGAEHSKGNIKPGAIVKLRAVLFRNGDKFAAYSGDFVKLPHGEKLTNRYVGDMIGEEGTRPEFYFFERTN